jgi:hypothetical protein
MIQSDAERGGDILTELQGVARRVGHPGGVRNAQTQGHNRRESDDRSALGCYATTKMQQQQHTNQRFLAA